MTKEELSRLYWLRKEIAGDMERLREIEITLDGLKAQALTGMPRGHKHDPDMHTAEIQRATELRKMIRAKMAAAQKERIRLESYIIAQDDPLIRMILTYRFIDGKTWAGVAASIGGGNDPDACRMLLSRWLEKNE